MKRTDKILPLNENAIRQARQRWNSIGKPLHSLGLLEDSIIKIAGIIGSSDVKINKRCAVVFCADNGVVREGVTQTDSSVTMTVAEAIASGASSINRLAQTFNAEVIPVDIGMNTDSRAEKILNRKIAFGTKNIADGSAMTRKQAAEAISMGIDIAKECAEKGYDILVTGEMGIGNTTTSSAIASVLLNTSPESVTGRGAGLDNEKLKRKIEVIKRAVDINKPYADDALDVLSKLGGFDIAGMTGLFLGGAIYRIPVVIDGFISAVAAALAVKIAPLARDHMLCSHVSAEPAGIKILRHIGLKPIITAGLCLGEGTGGIMLLPLLDGALSVYRSAHSFNELKIKQYEEY
ncbi:MAG: nicotinate-nucleotide--dimethylbenzimidazole phosphoribosyltransferase [Clostridium sp.]|nr:nicotinate-nucleotide--dimethylbenzimidazole phosphoribosyltransferase [Clostridium sp.]MCM1546996.1 nicotinate-nucleotide--dimethylbenzimidazole phosphoribosyltransferase [Ruminococcus sp.]